MTDLKLILSHSLKKEGKGGFLVELLPKKHMFQKNNIQSQLVSVSNGSIAREKNWKILSAGQKLPNFIRNTVQEPLQQKQWG